MVAEAAATEAAKNPGFFIFFFFFFWFGDGIVNSSSVEKSLIGMNRRESGRKSWEVEVFLLFFLVVEVEGR